VAITGCFRFQSSKGGGEAEAGEPRKFDARDVVVPDRYQIELVASGFTFPTSVTFDERGRTYVLEAGYSYGEAFDTPRLLEVGPAGRRTVVAAGHNGPWTGIVYDRGAFYVAEGGELEGGRILRIEGGRTTAIVEGLPSKGDHHTNGPAIGPDGWLYFSVGTATNSAIVGTDNAEFGWLKRNPTFRDVPCRDVVLTGANFTTDNALGRAGSKAVTGAYLPFGTPSAPGQVIEGRVPCSGAVLRVRKNGGDPELVAWGFRNPFGLAFAPDGNLYVSDNGYDTRGSRPVFGAADPFWRVVPGGWYGWPDYAEGRPVFGEDYQPPDRPIPPRLLRDHPSEPPAPVARFPVHSSSNGFDFSRSERFGFIGQAFVAQFGDQATGTGKVMAPVGFKVVRVDPTKGTIEDFAVNGGEKNGPASLLGSGGLERPVAARFDPSGEHLYVVDFGVLRMEDDKPHPERGTGALWRIYRESPGQ
jgi:glucose/arabinose dehydrogenase